MDKSPEMKKFRDDIGKALFGIVPSEALRQGICLTCGEDAKEFSDELSKKEYSISVMCQKCQDEIFGEAE